MELRQEQKLKQTLSQNMLQSTEILQMGQLELKEYLEDLALENPVVDMDEMRSEKSSDDKGESNEDFIRRLEELQSMDAQNRQYYQDEQDEASRFEPAERPGMDLRDALMDQILFMKISKEEFRILEYMILNLDDNGYLTEDLSVEPIDYNIGRVDISDDVIDMIADNLDPEGSGSSKNSLYLAGEIVSRLPVSLYLEPEFKTAAAPFLKFDVTVDATKEINEIEEPEETRLYAESLRQLVDNAAINIPVTLEKYYPGRGFETDKPQIEIKLHLIKHGGLKLDI